MDRIECNYAPLQQSCYQSVPVTIALESSEYGSSFSTSCLTYEII